MASSEVQVPWSYSPFENVVIALRSALSPRIIADIVKRADSDERRKAEGPTGIQRGSKVPVSKENSVIAL